MGDGACLLGAMTLCRTKRVCPTIQTYALKMLVLHHLRGRSSASRLHWFPLILTLGMLSANAQAPKSHLRPAEVGGNVICEAHSARSATCPRRLETRIETLHQVRAIFRKQ